MAINNTQLNVYLDKVVVGAGVAINCVQTSYAPEWIKVYYGTAKTLKAVYGVDYNVSLALNFNSYNVIPTAGFITKLNNLGQGNNVRIARELPYTNDLTETDAFVRAKLVFETNMASMKLAQIQWFLDNTNANIAALDLKLTDKYNEIVAIGAAAEIAKDSAAASAQQAEDTLADVLLNARAIRTGVGAPAPGLGNVGDVYIDGGALVVYGPKTGGGWPAGVAMTLSTIFTFNTRFDVLSRTVDPSATHLRTAGYTTVGDRGDALYKRVGAQPAHPGKFQAADGVWWELVSTPPSAPQLGAVRDNATDDAPAVENTQLVNRDGVELPGGTYKMVPKNVSPFYFANAPATLVYRAVALTISGMRFFGRGILHAVSRAGVAADDVQPIFATDKNANIGDINDLEISGITFDPANDADAVNSNQRFMYLTGLRGGRFTDLKAHSSQARRGYMSHIHNSSDLHIRGYRHDKVTGGFNFRFVKRVVFTDFIYYDFSEAMDFDGTQDQVIVQNGHFESTSRLNQCIDLNSQVDALVGNFTVRNVGNIVTINHKTTTPDNYADYVSNAFVKNQSNSQRIVVTGITGKAVASDVQPSFYLGWDWSAGSLAGRGPVRDVSIRDIDLQDVGLVLVRGCGNLHMSNINLQDVLSANTFAAVHMFSAATTPDQIAWDDLDVEIVGMNILRAQRGSLSISAPSRVRISGLRTEGGNTLGGAVADVILTGLHTRACRAQVDGLNVEGNVIINGDLSGIPAWAINTFYKRNSIVTNDGGKYYRAKTEGRSAGAGGPTGTNLNIVDDGTAGIAAWVPVTAYNVDDVVANAGKYYICFTAGNSAAAGGPSTTDQFIQDGTCVWRPVAGTITWEHLPSPFSVTWGRNNRVRGTIQLQGDASKYIFGNSVSCVVGDVPATGLFNAPVFVAKRRTLVTSVSYTSNGNVVASDTNNRSVVLRRARAGVTANIGTLNTNLAGGSWTALVPKDGGVDGSAAGAQLEPGDAVLINSNSTGTGVQITGLAATVNFIEH